MPVLGGMRRHGALELLLVLPDGSKSLVPAAWTDVDPSGVNAVASMSTLGSLSDLLQACDLVVDLAERRGVERGQAARKSPCEEDFHAACPAQSDARPGQLDFNTDLSKMRSAVEHALAHLKNWRLLSEEGGRYRAPLDKYSSLLKAVTGLFFFATYE